MYHKWMTQQNKWNESKLIEMKKDEETEEANEYIEKEREQKKVEIK